MVAQGMRQQAGISAPADSSSGRSTLPVPRTPLLGRGAELADARSLLGRDDVGLLTLTGAGGSGKTRLAIEIASQLADGFADGAVFVPLAPVTDPDHVIDAIADALELRETAGRSVLDRVLAHLADRQLLLVLDNVEHVIDAAPSVATLLARCARLKVLATSRAALRLSGEHELPVHPLPVPSVGKRDQGPGTREGTALLLYLLEYPSVELFCQRAAAVNPAFALDAESGRAVAEICARLDGLPLAIELAAARMKLFTPRSLLARLDQRLAVLTGGPRDLPARQQTLRDTIAWSYDQLSAPEQSLFRRLAVFAGGCTPEAAEAVCGGLDVLEGIASLVDKSLLRRDEAVKVDGALRFSMLETIREFGLSELALRDDASAIDSAHSAFFLAFVESGAGAINSPEEQRWLDQVDADQDNLRAVMRWALDGNDGGAALRLAVALAEPWRLRGRLSEARQWLEAALLLDPDPPAARRARALLGIGTVAYEQGDYAETRQRSEAALAIFKAEEDRRGMAAAFNNLGRRAYAQGEYPEARRRYGESLAISRELNDSYGCANVLNNLGMAVWRVGDYAEARTLMEESLAIARRHGHAARIPSALNNLALVSQRLGDVVAARRSYEEALDGFRAAGDRRGVAIALVNLGSIDQQEGDMQAALARYEECLAVRRELDDRDGIASSILHIAIALEQLGEFTAARASYEESIALAQEIGQRNSLAYAYRHLGELTRREGDLATAHALHERSLAAFRELGERPGIALALRVLGDTCRMQGERVRARSLYAEALTIAMALGERRSLAAGLEGVAALDAGDDPARSVRLIAAADTVRLSIRTPVPPADRSDHEQRLATLREQLDDDAFASAWDEGKALTIEEAVALATAEPPAGASPATGPASPRRASLPGGLTAREAEVLALIAAGHTNQEIAQTLVLSVTTVQRHIANIYAKIDARGRADATAFAIRHGLTSPDS